MALTRSTKSTSTLAADRKRCRDLLAQHPLFAWLKGELITTLAEQAAVARYREGQSIFKRGSKSEGIYIVAEGEVLFISGHEDNPNEQNASTCEAGGIFGELSLIAPRRRRADARAGLDTTLFVLRLGVLEKFASRHPDQFAVLVTNLARDLARRLREQNTRDKERKEAVGEAQS
jgi:CRP-like cAMP-binding protein